MIMPKLCSLLAVALGDWTPTATQARATLTRLAAKTKHVVEFAGTRWRTAEAKLRDIVWASALPLRAWLSNSQCVTMRVSNRNRRGGGRDTSL